MASRRSGLPSPLSFGRTRCAPLPAPDQRICPLVRSCITRVDVLHACRRRADQYCRRVARAWHVRARFILFLESSFLCGWPITFHVLLHTSFFAHQCILSPASQLNSWCAGNYSTTAGVVTLQRRTSTKSAGLGSTSALSLATRSLPRSIADARSCLMQNWQAQ
jgi:hypothetical protein